MLSPPLPFISLHFPLFLGSLLSRRSGCIMPPISTSYSSIQTAARLTLNPGPCPAPVPLTCPLPLQDDRSAHQVGIPGHWREPARVPSSKHCSPEEFGGTVARPKRPPSITRGMCFLLFRQVLCVTSCPFTVISLLCGGRFVQRSFENFDASRYFSSHFFSKTKKFPRRR